MSMKLKEFLGGVTLLGLSMGVADAADLNVPPFEPFMPEVTSSPIGGNWYLRGDLGYAINASVDGEIKGPDGKHTLSGTDAKDAWTLGAGFGYRFNDYVRTDLTFDYRDQVNYTGSCNNGSAPNTKVASISGLANVYVEAGEWYGFAPYVGAGVGAAWVNVENKAQSSFSSCGLTSVEKTSEDDWTFTAAAMAGVGYRVTDQLVVDAGYRYSWLDSFSSGIITDTGTKLTFKDVAYHEFRIGFRYDIR